jgi:hypothetical protein
MSKITKNLIATIQVTPLTIAEQTGIKGGMTTCEEKRKKIKY